MGSSNIRAALAEVPCKFESVSVNVELGENEWRAVRLLARACALPVPLVFRAFAHAVSSQLLAGAVGGDDDTFIGSVNVIDFMLAFDDEYPAAFPGVSFGGE